MAKKKIFISYEYKHDRKYKNLLQAWDSNAQFDFSFRDQSADVSVNSRDATAIKRAISAKINASTYFLCIVGRYTHKSHWIEWEIEKAKELKKKIVAVKVDRIYTSPPGLFGCGASWAHAFTFDAIKRAVTGAK